MPNACKEKVHKYPWLMSFFIFQFIGAFDFNVVTHIDGQMEAINGKTAF